MLRVCLVGLVAGGHSGIPRYAAALAKGIDQVAPEFPDLSLGLVTTARGERQVRARNIKVELATGLLADANEGPGRILAEQVNARKVDADLLHFFDLTGPVLRRRQPFINTIHDAAARHGFEPLRMAHKRILQPWAIRHAVAEVAVSAFARDEAVRLFGADRKRIQVIHSGPGLLAANGGHAFAESRSYLLYVGNLATHKNLPFLVRAFERAGVNARLLMIGRPGEGFKEVRRAIQASRARDRIELRCDVSDADLDGMYRGASMLLLPSKYEGFGFTALEAMARGCPVLASDIPALREVSGDGAWLLPADDDAAWSDAIRCLASDRARREELGRRGEATVQRYAWDQTARRICQLFMQIGAVS